jgi:RNA polymerase sigma-70 factor, ECF subfamily
MRDRELLAMVDMDIERKIQEEMPRLRRYARALTRDPHAAEDLVQDCIARALSRTHLWRQGTDLRAWLFTIMHNQYVNNVRRAIREGTAVGLSEHEPALCTHPIQVKRIELRDLERGLAGLPEEQRAVLLLVGIEGMRYEEVALILKIPVGTVRSRLSRGRETLRRVMGFDPVEIGRTESRDRFGPAAACSQIAFEPAMRRVPSTPEAPTDRSPRRHS